MVTRKKISTDMWFLFQIVLQFFKVFGLMPLTVRRSPNFRRKLEVEFSRKGFILAVVLLILTSVHAMWAPTSLLHLEKSILSCLLKNAEEIRSNVSFTPQQSNVHTKLSNVVKIMHPLLRSLTAITARALSVFVLTKSMSILFKALCRTDVLLSLPPNFYVKNVWSLATLAAFTFSVHFPVMLLHILHLNNYYNFWEEVWEVFALLNVFTGFAMELQFGLFCLSTRYRFTYINNLLKNFTSEEFLYDVKSVGKLKRILSKWKGFVLSRNSQNTLSNFARNKRKNSSLFLKLDIFHGKIPLKPSSNLIQFQSKKASEPKTSNILKSLRRGHILLFDVMQHINDIYRIHLLVSIFSSVTQILFNFYFIIFGFVNSTNLPAHVNTRLVSSIIVWITYYSFRFMMLVIFAHFATSASKEAKGIIPKIDVREFEFTSKRELKMFSEHLFGRDFEFSACGLFKLNTALITTSFSTCITYLVIMAQFE